MDTIYKLLVEIGNLRTSTWEDARINMAKCAIVNSTKMMIEEVVFSFYKDDSIISEDVPLTVKITFLTDDVKKHQNEIMGAILQSIKIIFFEKTKNPLMIPIFVVPY